MFVGAQQIAGSGELRGGCEHHSRIADVGGMTYASEVGREVMAGVGEVARAGDGGRHGGGGEEAGIRLGTVTFGGGSSGKYARTAREWWEGCLRGVTAEGAYHGRYQGKRKGYFWN